MEASEKGWVDGRARGSKWGDYHGRHGRHTEKIARCAKGSATCSPNGIAPAAEHFGHPEIGMHARARACPAYDPRGMKGMGIAYATSNRGACHLRAYTPASELGVIPHRPTRWTGRARAS